MKKMKIFTSILLAVVLALASFSAMAVYEEQIIFSDAVYYDADGTTVIDGPQNGTFYVETTATYNGSEERSAMMMAALYDSETGEIKSVAVSAESAVWPGEGEQTVRVKLENVENIDSYTFKCFMIDDLMRHTPLDNGAPATPGAVTSTGVTKTSADIAWGAAEDDFDNVESYYVYKNGGLVGETTSLDFTIDNLLRNSESVYSVRAYDGQLLSEAVKSEPIATEEIIDTIFDFEFQHGKLFTVPGSGLAAVMSTGTHEFQKKGVMYGRRCAIIGKAKYPGFAAADQEYITQDDHELILELTYLDYNETNSGELIYINAQTTTSDNLGAIPQVYNPQYHPVYNPGVAEIVSEASAAGAPKITNTGVWKTVVVKFANVSFVPGGAANQLGKQFYIRASNTSFPGMYVASGNLYKPQDYIPMNPNMQVIDGGQTVYAMEFTLPGGYDVAYTIDEIDGSKCVASTDAGNLSYKVTDLDVKNAPSAMLEVTFYDDNAGDVLYVGGYEIPMDGSGWRTAVLEVNGSDLGDGFEISKSSNTTVYLKDLQAYVK